MSSSANEDSGRLWLDGDVVCYESKTYAGWQIQVADIRIIGEVTNQNGPCTDDYFICFVTDASGSWKEASFYATGRDETLEQLSDRLGRDLELRLSSSTDFASRILWPPHLAGEPLFEFRNKVSHGVWQYLKGLLCPQNLRTIRRTLLVGLRSTGSDSCLDGSEYAEAHRHSISHRPEILASEQCGCFHCLQVFSPKTIKEWIDEGDGNETALCPKCGIDSVIGSAAGFPLTNDFLSEMNRVWFGV